MPTLDVSDVPICAEFSDTFEVLRRPEVISEHGRAYIRRGDAPQIAVGTIYPTGDNSLVRQEDYQTGAKTITVVTPFRLRTASEGFQPDYLMYRSTMYIVKKVNDWSPYGAGFIEAECSSVLSQDAPPQ